MKSKKIISLSLLLFGALVAGRGEAKAQKNIADQVVWMVGDEPILLSDIAYQKLRLRSEGARIEGNPDCFIPEQMAIQKLFLNQAKIDSVEANELQVSRYLDMWVDNAISQIGSKEKLEEYFGKKLSQIREDERREIKNAQTVQAMQQKIAQNVQVTPSEIRAYFAQLPSDSLPFIPKTVEVEKIVLRPHVNLKEIDRIKGLLREYAEEISQGKRDFSTLARLYSEDRRTAIQGGEYGFVGRSALESEFANVVFNLNDSKRVSHVVKTEDGYHIVQLIEKRGDLVNFRHILMRPRIETKDIEEAQKRLDSIAQFITDGKFTFTQAAEYYSDDKDTRNNGGLMTNRAQSDFEGSANFRYEDLPQDIARVASQLKVGEMSKPFLLKQDNGQEELVLIRLKDEHPEHLANMNTDFRVIKELALAKKRSTRIDEWIKEKQKQTPIRINPDYRGCDFKYSGWVQSE